MCLGVRDAKFVEGFGITWPQRNGDFQIIDRVGVSPSPRVDASQAVISASVFGIKAQGDRERSYCFISSISVVVQNTQVVTRHGKVWFKCYRSLAGVDCLRGSSKSVVNDACTVVRHRKIWIEFHCLLQ